ncbi:Crp/Fnr family transcriptional regulator [Paraburkholderia sediminicola]|uniref:Crp/Fnr family transcriptional regulator n=1 Tax=Paraburkholderia sediminicola TaxID=458836 RepID=UPI0038B95D6A
MFYASWDACIPHTDKWLNMPSLGRIRHHPQGTTLYREHAQHKHFHLIRSGFVQADMMHPDGRRLLLELMGPGTLFGEGAAFDNGIRYINARCVTEVALSTYSPEDITGCSDAVELLASLIRIMSGKQRILAVKLLQFSSDDPESRVRQLLARLAAVRRRAAGDGTTGTIEIHFSQEQIGEMCGLSRVSVSRSLRKLADEGVLETHVKRIEITNAPKLWGV